MANKKIKISQFDGKSTFKSFLSEKIALSNFIYAAIVLNVLSLIAILLLQNNLPPQVPIFYGFAEGEQQLSETFGLLLPNAYSLGIILINFIFSIFIENEFLKKILSITSFTISLLSVITVVKIIFLVGYF